MTPVEEPLFPPTLIPFAILPTTPPTPKTSVIVPALTETPTFLSLEVCVAVFL